MSRRILMLPLATLAFMSVAADAQTGGYVRPIDPTNGMLRRHLIERLNAMREKELRQQAADGGTLTPEHRHQLQVAINDANARYVEQRRYLGQPVIDPSVPAGR